MSRHTLTETPAMMLQILQAEADRRINRELKDLGAQWGFKTFELRPSGQLGLGCKLVGITEDGSESEIQWGAAEFARTLDAIHTLRNFFRQRP
jgi:hypothetical protein